MNSPLILVITLTLFFLEPSILLGEGFVTPALPVIPDRSFSVSDYGARGDTVTTNTASIQQTIDACLKSGGGVVTVPPGDYLTGPLTLGSYLRLNVTKGATIRIQNDIASYPKGGRGFSNSITANSAHDLEISGEGTIDGQGAPWWNAFRADKTGLPHRPFLIVLSDCTRVLVKGVRLINSPSFHLVPQHCRDVTIDSVTITAPADSPNTDAIDPSGWNFLITRCRIDVGDDNIAVKAGKGAPPEGKAASCGNFTVTSCTFLHGHGLSIGSETDGGLDGMRVSDCSFEGTTAGIRMKSNREKGGVVQNLSYDRITMKNVNTPVQITSYYPKTPSNPAEEDSLSLGSRTPVWKNITISNLKAVDSTNAGILWGLPKIPITDVTFKNVEIEAVTGMTILNAKGIRFDQSSIAVQKGKKLTTTNADFSGL